MTADPEGYGGSSGWRNTARSPFQSDAVKIDPLADRYFSWKSLDVPVAVLIGLNAGIEPSSLVLPPDGSGISRKAWSDAIEVTTAFVSGPAEAVLARTGYATGYATGRFLQWLVTNPAVQALVRSITLSAAPAKVSKAAGGMPAAGGLPSNTEVVLAVIDDWIGVANQRFRLASGATRCIGLWLQGVDGIGQPPVGFGSGRGLDASEIDALLATAHGDEELFERMLYAPGHTRPTQRLSHGTHVADLFAGYGHAPASEAKEGKNRPMIGVALPHIALRDTSGLPLLVPLVNAVAYVIETVLAQGGKKPPPVVINYSNGAMADICHHLSETRDAITAMMDAYNLVHPKAPIAFVTAAGNSFQERCFARLPRQGSMPPAKRLPLDLRIMPDDKTRSYVTYELPTGVSAYSLTVEPPGLPAGTVDMANQSALLLDLQGQRIAQLLYDPPSSVRPGGIFTLIVEPTTDPLEGLPGGIAPPGVWQLTLGGSAALTGGEVKVSIARDVAPLGFPTFGRQAHFEDTAYERYQADGRPGETDTPASAVQRGGAMNILGTDLAAGPVSVAARFVRSGKPTYYSSAGSGLLDHPPMSVRAPDVIADADHTDVMMGLLATGIRSGSFVAMNGTSVSAPLVARNIATALASGTPPVAAPGANVGREIARQLANGVASQPPPDARRGFGPLPTTGVQNVALIALRDQ
jgi:hypothetical protein